MSVQYLTGATSGTEYKISGFSSMPSYGPPLDGYSNLYTPYDFGSYDSPHPVIWSSADRYLGGIGLFVNYDLQKYYWYIFSVGCDGHSSYPGFVTFEVLNLDGSSTTEDKVSEGYPVLCEDWGNSWSECSSMNNFDINGAPDLAVLPHSYLTTAYCRGASLGFWPFLGEQFY